MLARNLSETLGLRATQLFCDIGYKGTPDVVINGLDSLYP